MQFKVLSILTVALSAVSVQAFTATDVINNIKTITKISADTNKIAMDLSPFTFITSAPKLVAGFRGIITEVTKDISSMGGQKPSFKKEDQLQICDVFTTFVKVHQDLLNTVIGKGSFLAETPFTAPIAAVLRLLEKGVDTLAFGIIGLVPTCESKAQAELKKLQGSIDNAISVYA